MKNAGKRIGAIQGNSRRVTFMASPFFGPSRSDGLSLESIGRTADFLSCPNRIRNLGAGLTDVPGFLREEGFTAKALMAPRIREEEDFTAKAQRTRRERDGGRGVDFGG